MPPHRLVTALAALSLAAFCLAPATSATAARIPTCHGHRATIAGTVGNDRIVGTRGRDVIVGLAGRDRLFGGGGDDIICGDEGHDEIVGGGGDDLIDGGLDHDRLDSGTGDDTVYGGNGLGDRFEANGGNDTWITGTRDTSGLYSRDFFDYEVGGPGVTIDLPHGVAHGPRLGHDTLRIRDLAHGVVMFGSTGRDTVIGGPGPDQYTDVAGPDTVRLGAGDDVIHHGQNYTARTGSSLLVGGAGDDTIWDSEPTASIRGGAGDDRIRSQFGNMTVSAGPGEDHVELHLWPPFERTVVSGGDGSDTLEVVPDHVSPDPDATLTLDLAAGTVGWSDEASLQVTDFENGSVGFDQPGVLRAFVIRGTEGDNRLAFLQSRFDAVSPVQIFGLGGDDSLEGGNGDDLLDGGLGNDTGSGGEGTDTCVSIEGPLVVDGATCEVSHEPRA